MRRLLSDNSSCAELVKDVNGFYRLKGIAAKEGIYDYNGKKVFISKEILEDTESNAGFSGVPVVIGHVLVTPENYKDLSVGSVTNPIFNEGKLQISGVINAKEGIDAIESGFTELSPSYYAKNVPNAGAHNGETYTHVQTKRIYNHLALCPKGTARGGEGCSIIFDSIKEVNNVITYMYNGIKLTFESQEDLDKFKTSLQLKNDAIDINKLQSEIETLNAQLAEARAQIEAAESEEEKAAIEKALEERVKSMLQAILEAMEIAPEEITADSITGMTIPQIQAKALGLKYDVKMHTTEYLRGMIAAKKQLEKSASSKEISNATRERNAATLKVYGVTR